MICWETLFLWDLTRKDALQEALWAATWEGQSCGRGFSELAASSVSRTAEGGPDRALGPLCDRPGVARGAVQLKGKPREHPLALQMGALPCTDQHRLGSW